MALSATSMKSRIEAYMAAVGAVQTSDAGTAQGYRDAMLLALCKGIVDEIQQNATVPNVQSGGSTASVV